MKNSIEDLRNHLFAALERLNDDELMAESGEKEINRAKAIGEVATQIVNSAKVEVMNQVTRVKSAKLLGINEMKAILPPSDFFLSDKQGH